jgi:hypothetical protein
VSGSGKGVSIERRLAELKPRRLLIWDPRNEYPKWAEAVRSLPELVQRVAAAKGGPFRLRYVPGASVKLDDAFAICCKLAFNAKDLLYLAEELSDVTRASWAPAAWRQCITQGRHHDLHLIGATQRPALIDKNFLANATIVRCLALGYEEDEKTMAKELKVPLAAVEAIKCEEGDGWARLGYLERDRRQRTVTAGVLEFKAGRLTEKRQPMQPAGQGAT